SMLYEEVVEVDERVGAHGELIRPLDAAAAGRDLRAAYGRGIRACAIVLMHGYRFPAHEQQLAQLAGAIGFTQISVSHRVSPLMRLVSRGDTTVADAYLSPVLRRYVDRVAGALPDVKLQFMQSSGGLSDAGSFHGKDAILSGPAGGIVGAASAARAAGCEKIIAFDMGGTSTDVGHFAGAYERALDVEISGVRLRTPILRIHTVAAGGGSICRFDGVRLRVGPESAGADPGPAAYRRGGPLTVTDCNVLLGRIQPDFFPALFGADGKQPLDPGSVQRQFDELAGSLASAGTVTSPAAVAAGCIRIAVENMANAIKKISVQRGHDVTEYTLVCFGGAAGQHACQVADALGMRQVLIHPLAGVLSAYGIGLAETIVMRQRTAEVALEAAALEKLRTPFALLEHEAGAELVSQGFAMDDIGIEQSLLLKYDGTDSTLQLPLRADSTAESLTREFLDTYRVRYGFHVPGRRLVIDTIAVAARGRNADAHGTSAASSSLATPRGALAPVATRPVHFEGEWRDTPFFDRATLRPGYAIDGPAIVCEPNTTVVIERGWRACLTPANDLVLDRHAAIARHDRLSTSADPVLLEIFNNLFMAIAEQMGVTLANTASSVNIKERLDFSCALFDETGQLIANAPHMPVHLGSMGESVQEVLRRHGRALRGGDAYALNAPYAGGTHLPDVTVVMPVFLAGTQRGSPTFFVAARGHHADIGGITPGSMPADSRSIDEEGVLLDSVPVVIDGEFLEGELRRRLADGPYPARNITQNLADLRAQVAACQKGSSELLAMAKQYGLDVVQAYMQHVQANAEAAVRQVIGVLEDGDFSYEMDSGAVIRTSIRIDRATRAATIDFTGTSAQQPDNFNAPLPVTRAAVLYVFRTLVDDEIPMNAGCLAPLKLIVPEGCMLNPRYPAAVVAGNVETSQAVTDCLYGALGVLAASQGTMNNFTFGNERHQYYETISGGSGAGPGFDGTDAVQTHMTNSRLTDPEVLEWRFPVRLESFRIRRGSGGAGRHRGGDGVERRVRFLEPLTAVMLANHRRVAPFGMAGGRPGATGRNWIERADGRREEFGATFATDVAEGDIIAIETPGGGGFGD
ncbi:MAG TPA: hydantoinase B/oxoprolinase family protein, partial [Steroidobacteraceae bacterium]|nr:hydantoinase B/oxoprolinase family protein [Steroidobacteraceae bacterium]